VPLASILATYTSAQPEAVTKYVPNVKAEGLYTLDKKDGFTLFAFILRRVVLVCSLIMALYRCF